MTKTIDDILEGDIVCHYCGEPFKECDTIIPGIGLIIDEIDIRKYKNNYWHRGCVSDFKKEAAKR